MLILNIREKILDFFVRPDAKICPYEMALKYNFCLFSEQSFGIIVKNLLNSTKVSRKSENSAISPFSQPKILLKGPQVDQ